MKNRFFYVLQTFFNLPLISTQIFYKIFFKFPSIFFKFLRNYVYFLYDSVKYSSNSSGTTYKFFVNTSQILLKFSWKFSSIFFIFHPNLYHRSRYLCQIQPDQRRCFTTIQQNRNYKVTGGGGDFLPGFWKVCELVNFALTWQNFQNYHFLNSNKQKKKKPKK